uniref:Pericentriolar material 1 protein C-terminal domain-containing protein n=1 Tax=Ascaris lumbricoides TaxID=6252 RepID=A0A9J2PZ85_ASCLU
MVDDRYLERQPITKADRSSCVLALREFLLSAQPQILREFADVILKLANGEVISGLDGVLQTFLNSADNNLPASNTSTEKEERQPITKADRSSCVLALREFLLSAQPQILREFADVILKLANGEVISGLDGVLQTFLNSADNNLPASNTSTEKEEWRGEGEAEQEPEGNSGKSTSPEMTQSVTLTLRKPTTNSDAESGREQTLQDQRIEQAKRRLSTSKAKLQKQRTLERVRCFTGDESGEEKNEEELRGLERDICRIIEGVLPWIKEHSEVIADETGMHELRDVLLQRSSAICFPDGAASDLFEKQLSTIVDDTLSQYYGEKVGADREQLIFDISEVLYNELAFFQLMHNIDNMVDTKQETFEVGSAE